MISPGRFWRAFRRDVSRGWTASRHYYRTLPRLQDWKWPFWNEKPLSVPLHVLTGKDDWQLAAWMTASFFYFSEHSWSLVIHDDGTLPEEAKKAFASMFPKPRIIGRDEADDAAEKYLKPFPFCYEYRGLHPLARKVFDVPHFAEGERYLCLDSDVLFFNHPREIVRWAQNADDQSCWFNAAPEETSLISAKEALDEMGVKLWPKVDTGISLITKEAMDLDFCDRALAETSMLRGKVERVEQTLTALCASRLGRGGLLPAAAYEISKGKFAAPTAVARHYSGVSRERFFGEGLARVGGVLLQEEEA